MWGYVVLGAILPAAVSRGGAEALMAPIQSRAIPFDAGRDHTQEAATD